MPNGPIKLPANSTVYIRPMSAQLLLIDDEIALRSLLARILSLEGFIVTEAGTAKEGLGLLAKGDFPVVICDVKLPDANGVSLVADIKTRQPAAEVILLTAFGNIPDGVQAIKNGAFDYLTKGDDNDRIIPLVNRALEKAQLRQRIAQLEKAVGQKYSFPSILGDSAAIRQAVALAKKVAPTDATVLLTGETGTGKEVFAQAIHQASNRAGKAFVAVNCSTFGRDLLESELFGHTAGSFTGASKDKRGLFEEANHGTLFLDEIGELALELQAKLLRVLETGEFIKVGNSQPTRVHVRVIAATNRDLAAESLAGHFRSDLFYRLSVFELRLPALRERRQDIEPLARHFIRFFAEKINRRSVPAMGTHFAERLRAATWKGNIRELRNVLERAVILAEDQLTEDLLPFDLLHPVADQAPDGLFDLAALEKQTIRRALAFTKGNKAEAARLLGIGLTTLYRKLEE